MGFWNDGISSTSRPAPSRHNSSSYSRDRSFFGSSSGSRPGVRPRSGYINRIYNKLRRFLRDLYYYARRHPVKVFMLVIMPLLTGGALHKILAQFGIRLPPGLLKAFGGTPGGSGGGRGGGEYERYSYRGSEGGMGGGMGGNLQNLVGIAKMFM